MRKIKRPEPKEAQIGVNTETPVEPQEDTILLSELFDEIMEGLEEGRAHFRGEITLKTTVVEKVERPIVKSPRVSKKVSLDNEL